jgi:4-hydroxy-tetrahydrodipicolinate synthase
MSQMLNPTTLQGSICALITPFGANNELDIDAIARLFDRHEAAGTDALVIAGSTGESVALGDDEYAQLLQLTRSRLSNKVRFIAGTGTPNTQKTITATKIAADAGAAAALVVTPAYARPTQLGLKLHYLAIAEQSAIPIILYNVPSRTGVDLLPETVQELALHPNIIGIKEARTDDPRMQALLALQSKDFSVLSGDDGHAVRAIELGARGLISVVANVRPTLTKAMIAAALSGNQALVQQHRTRLMPLIDALGIEPNPIPVKWALAELGFCRADLRLPLTTLSAEHQPSIRAALAETPDILE